MPRRLIDARIGEPGQAGHHGVDEHNYIALEAALSGQGAIVAPLGVVAGQIERGTLIQLAPEQIAPGPLFTMLFDARGSNERHARTLIAWLKKQVGARLALVASTQRAVIHTGIVRF